MTIKDHFLEFIKFPVSNYDDLPDTTKLSMQQIYVAGALSIFNELHKVLAEPDDNISVDMFNGIYNDLYEANCKMIAQELL